MLKPDARWILGFLIIMALLLRQGLAVMLLGLLGLALLVATLWSRWAVRRVQYDLVLSAAHAFVGDDVVLTQRIANRKLLGLPSLKIDDLVPETLDYHDQRLLPSTQYSTKVLRRTTALRPYEAISWHVKLRCIKRGLYTFGPTRLEMTDAFGLETRTLDLPTRTRLVVYPTLIALPHLQLRAQHPVGDQRAPRQLLTDPTRTIGVRDYRRDDPLKAIHWGATARRGELQTRVFEPTTSLDVAIVLGLDTFEHYWEGVRYDLIEHMISIAATVATEAADDRLGVGLYTNAPTADSGELIRFAPSRAPGQIPVLLEALAKLVPYAVTPLPNLLQYLGPALPWGATLVIVGAVPSEAMQTALLRLTRRGRRILWLYAGEATPPRLRGIEVLPVELANAPWAKRQRQSMTSPGAPRRGV